MWPDNEWKSMTESHPCSFLFFSFLFCDEIPASESREREAMNRRGVHETVQDRAGLFEASSLEEPQNDRRYLADRLGGLAGPVSSFPRHGACLFFLLAEVRLATRSGASAVIHTWASQSLSSFPCDLGDDSLHSFLLSSSSRMKWLSPHIL